MASDAVSQEHVTAALAVRLPKVSIEYCTQCRWMLRAAYYAQELLSTFGTAIGEISLRPATGGIFVVTIEHLSGQAGSLEKGGEGSTQVTRLWDRKSDGGFPETKELKRRLRDVVEPGRDLGHVDKHHGNSKNATKPGDGEKTEISATKPGDQDVGGDPANGLVPPEAGKPSSKTCEDCN